MPKYMIKATLCHTFIAYEEVEEEVEAPNKKAAVAMARDTDGNPDRWEADFEETDVQGVKVFTMEEHTASLEERIYKASRPHFTKNPLMVMGGADA